MIAGKDAFKPGEAKNSWLTGTAAWNWAAISQDILGIKPGYDGLIIDPCVPKDWNKYKVTREYRGATYNITIKNPSGVCKGVSSLAVNGEPVQGNVVPIQAADSVNDVDAILVEAS
jgi:cellobiose phosphorylase